MTENHLLVRTLSISYSKVEAKQFQNELATRDLSATGVSHPVSGIVCARVELTVLMAWASSVEAPVYILTQHRHLLPVYCCAVA